MITEKKLEILHDHYKETFARIREVETSRDRLFLWVIGLFAVLALEIGYPASLGKSLGKIGVLGAELNLQALPLAALLDASWVLTFAIALRYCQASVQVNRQYPYLHMLEDVISPAFGSGIYQGEGQAIAPVVNTNVYRREGKMYLSEYPVLLEVAGIAYGILFPVIVMIAAGGLIIWEWKYLPYSIPNRAFDTVVTFALLAIFALYRIQPYLAKKRRDFQVKQLPAE